MPTYRWRADFVLRGLQLAHELTLGTIHVVPAQRDDVGHSKSTGHLTFETDKYLRGPEATKHVLSLLTPLVLSGAALGGSVAAPLLTSILLANQAELEASGVPIPLTSGLRVSFNVLSPDIPAPSLVAGYHTARALPPAAIERLSRAARWLWKANADPDGHDQFLALWIAFNVLYGKPHRREQRAIEEFIAEAFPTDLEAKAVLDWVHPPILEKLANSSLTVSRKKVEYPVADELLRVLDDPSRTQSHTAILRLACLVIYAVRCDIVHAGGSAVPPDALQLIWASRDVLKALLMRYLQSRLGLHPGATATSTQ
jgi:hypothetical protein